MLLGTVLCPLPSNDVRGLLVLLGQEMLTTAQNGQGEGEEFFGAAAPGAEGVEALEGVTAAGGIGLVGELGLDVVEALGAGLEVGAKLVLDKTADEALHGEFGQVVVFAGARDVVHLNGPELAEGSESTGDGAPGDAQTGLDLVEVQRLRAAVEAAVDLADRARQADQGGGADEAVDHGDFPGG